MLGVPTETLRWLVLPPCVSLVLVNREHDLTNPDFEPTDEDLRELSRAAFAHLPQARKESDERLRAEIARLRAAVLARLRETSAGAS